MSSFGRARRLEKPLKLLPGCHPRPGRWADLGSGDGVFTEVLGHLLGAGSSLVALDWDRQALLRCQDQLSKARSGPATSFVQADLGRPLPLRGLHGALMANVLHFFQDSLKPQVLSHIRQSLLPGGQLILVEYPTERGNRAVPYPMSAPQIVRLVEDAGFRRVHVAARTPSSFLREMVAITGWVGQGSSRLGSTEESAV